MLAAFANADDRRHAQQATAFEYCKALAGPYRKAVADGAATRLGQARANCPTNPFGSIPVFEKGLKSMNVELPARGWDAVQNDPSQLVVAGALRDVLLSLLAMVAA